MNAIVLSYDDRLSLAELIVRNYSEQCKDHNLVFKIPFTTNQCITKYLLKSSNVQLIKTAKSIKQSMIGLLAGINDNSFVYWCTDDRYIAHIYDVRAMKTVIDNIQTLPDSVDAIRLKSHRHNNDALRVGNFTFYRFIPTDIVARGFWQHQWIRCKVLKRVFINNGLPDNYTHISLNKHLIKNDHLFKHTIYVPHNSICRFGETTYRGRVTTNCLELAKLYKVGLPEKITLRKCKSIFF